MAGARQLPLPFLQPATFAEVDFIPAPSNAAALAWLARPAEWPLGRMILYGPAGTGKTHLLHLWCGTTGGTLWAASDVRDVPVLPRAGPVAVDDADIADEAALFHLINATQQANRFLLLAGREAAARWGTRLPDLASRLRASLTIGLGPAEETLLRPLLARLLAERQLDVKPAVQAWLLTHLPREAAALTEAVARLDRAALASGLAITRHLAARIVTEMGTADIASTPTSQAADEIFMQTSPPARLLL